MIRHLIWLSLVVWGIWWTIPQIAPHIAEPLSSALGCSCNLRSMQWHPCGITLKGVSTPYGLLEIVELNIGWNQGLEFAIAVHGADLIVPTKISPSTPHSIPKWLGLEISVSESCARVEGSDLLWRFEGTATHHTAGALLDVTCQAGVSRMRMHLQGLNAATVQGELDAESLPISILALLASSFTEPLLGDLTITAGIASGHLHIGDGSAYGDILLEYLKATDTTLGLELGIDEGLLSLSGTDGIHLSVSENGWLRWGNTGLNALTGSILWGDQLELDLAGHMIGAGGKRVHVSTRQEDLGWVARLELLKVPVQPAVAEIAFRGEHGAQSVIRLEHFGPEESAWLGHLTEPWLLLPHEMNWTAQEIEALAVVDWAAGHPCHINLKHLKLSQVVLEAAKLGSLSMETLVAELSGPCLTPQWMGQLHAEGCQWLYKDHVAFEDGKLHIDLLPGKTPQLLVKAYIDEKPWEFRLEHDATALLQGSGSWPSLCTHFPMLKSLQGLPIEDFTIEASSGPLGLQLKGSFIAQGSPSQLSWQSPSNHHVWFDGWKNTSLSLLPWSAQIKDLSIEIGGPDLCSNLSLDAHLQWTGEDLEALGWCKKGELRAGTVFHKLASAAEPTLQLRAHHLVNSELDHSSWWNPAHWQGNCKAQVHLEEDHEPSITGELAWSEGSGTLRCSSSSKMPLDLNVSWDSLKGSLQSSCHAGEDHLLQLSCALTSESPGNFTLSALPAPENSTTYLEHFNVEVKNWWPHSWDVEAYLPLRQLFSWMATEGHFSPSSVLSSAKHSIERRIPSQVKIGLKHLHESPAVLQVASMDQETTPWSFAIERKEGGWQLERGSWGPLHFAAKLVAAGQHLALNQAHLLSSSGQPVLQVSQASPLGLTFSLSRDGLPLLLDDLCLWAKGRDTWSKWLRLHQDLSATIAHDPERGWVLHIPEFTGKLRAMPLSCKDVELWVEDQVVFVKGTFCNRGKSDPFQLTLKHYPSGTGELLAEVAGERCSCGWVIDDEGHLQILAIEGGICGQTGHFTYQDGSSGNLRGSISLDLKALTYLVPDDVAEAIDKLSLGKGVVFEGTINLQDDLCMEGKLIGSDVDALGAVWEKLSADFYCSSTVLSLTSLQIKDSAGEIRAPRIEVREIEPKNWHLDMPLAGARQITMSRLRWPGNHKRAVKHLVIEEILLEGISGPADNPQAWAGHGHISFENEAPRPALLVLPAELLGNLGLDLALLEPVRGRIHFAFEDGFIRLKEFEDVVSIRNRSRFYLHPDPGFAVIGFDGTVNIRIWMKQFVVLKITQPLNLYITGNLRDPEISFQHSDKRCALTTLPEPGSN